MTCSYLLLSLLTDPLTQKHEKKESRTQHNKTQLSKPRVNYRVILWMIPMVHPYGSSPTIMIPKPSSNQPYYRGCGLLGWPLWYDHRARLHRLGADDLNFVWPEVILTKEVSWNLRMFFFSNVATQRFCICFVYFFFLSFCFFLLCWFGLFCVSFIWYVLVCWFVGLFVDLFWYIGVCSVHFLVCFGFHSVTQNLKSRKKIRCPFWGFPWMVGFPHFTP